MAYTNIDTAAMKAAEKNGTDYYREREIIRTRRAMQRLAAALRKQQQA